MRISHRYTYAPSLEPPSHLLAPPTPLGCHRALAGVPWVTRQIPTGSLVYLC